MKSMPGYGDATEEWRDIPGFEGTHQVSSHGRVRSLTRMVKATRAGHLRPAPGRVLTPFVKPCGHLQVSLAKRTVRLVHRLVALAFIGPAPEGLDVAHLDGNPANNRPENLAYVTRQENNQHVAFHGRRLLSADQVRHVRAKAAEGLDAEKRKQLAGEVGVTVRHLGHILRGRTYAYVT